MAQVNKIGVKGFRSLKAVSWEPDRLNLVIGANGSGKSNLLRALEMLQQSAAGKLRDSVVAEGGFRQLLWDRSGKQIDLKIEMTDQFISPIETSFTYDLVLRWRGFGDLFYVVRETLSESQCSGSGKDKAASSLIERDAKRALVMNSEGKLTAPSGAVSLDHTVLSDSSDDTRTILFRMALSSFRIYQDLVTRRRAPVREAAVPQPECALRPDGSNLIHVLHTLYSGHKESKNNIDAGMQAAFGQDFHELIFGPTEDERIRFGVRWRNLNEPVFAPSLSDGTLRFLMLLAVLANPEPGMLVAIDEPETGLHPRMFPIIAEFAASASERSTVVLTTHSPEFLDAFPSDCVPTTTVAECVDGETRLSKLDARDLERWLKEYSLGKLFKSGELEALS